MKRIAILVASLFAFVVSSCSSVDAIDPYSSYHINNEIDEVILVYVESTPAYSYLLSSGQIPMGTTIYPLQDNTWIARTYKLGVNVCTNENFTFSFVFKNGVKHTFSGEKIANDFRDANSWQKELRVDEYGTSCETYTYTFTQEDYEEIMALYE